MFRKSLSKLIQCPKQIEIKDSEKVFRGQTKENIYINQIKKQFILA
jgi:hypothetical protein